MCSLDICRICMNNDINLINIFTSTPTFSSISTAIMACAPISISETDTLPHTICVYCLEKLEIAYNFRFLSVQTDHTLRNSESYTIVKEENDEKLAIASITEITSVLDDADIKYEENSYDDFPLNNEQVSFEDDSDSDSDNDNDKNNDSDSTFSIDSNELSEKSYDSRKRLKKPSSSKLKLSELIPSNSSLVPNDDDGYFHCNQCEKKYKHKYDLQTHLILHTDYRFYCEQCGKEFYTAQYLRRHMSVHQTERRYNCEFCGLTFKQRTTLQSHRTIHLNVRQFKCEMCPKEFRLKSSLENHQKIHTGERPFICGTCGKTYKRKDHLTVHEQQLHIGKRFKCASCGQAFLTKRSMNTHMLRSCRQLS